MLNVELKGVSKSYSPGKTVLQMLDLNINAGELFFLLGPSGCGKTTLLRLLAGFLKPDTGTIFFAERDITHVAPERRDTGMVFQNYALWPHMSIFDNVAFGLDTRNIRGDERRRLVHEALVLVEMEEFAERKPASLSGGQQQRVALARALAFRPKLLLLDEPLSNLDAKLRDSMRSEIRRICKSAGLTAIYVTHDRKEALSMADRIAILNQGRLEQVGTPEHLYRRPLTRFTAEFMGQANFFPVTVNTVGHDVCVLDTPFGTMRAAKPDFEVTAGDRLTAMVRTECLRPTQEGTSHDNAFSGRLKAGSFQGENSVWEVSAGDYLLNVLEACPPHREPESGITLQITPEHLVLLGDQ